MDHIGFEVQNINAFVGKLQVAGIKTDAAIRNSANASGLLKQAKDSARAQRRKGTDRG